MVEMLPERNFEAFSRVQPTSATKHVLIVDDDPAMRSMLTEYLEGENFKVTAVADGDLMALALRNTAVDLIILDMKLGKEDGLDLIRRFSSPPEAPIIVITGQRREEADRIVGLELGADDYLIKPFSLRELLARIRAVLRRAASARQRSPGKESHLHYRFAGWELDMRTRRLVTPDGDTVPLTAGEFNLLTAFLRSPQQILTREQLLAASRVHDEEVFDRSIDVQILRLRRKLEQEPSEPKLIITERGAGYIFAAPVDVS
jgi:two-component system, OmpR family, response regulator